jgi:hypothetical protein
MNNSNNKTVWGTKQLEIITCDQCREALVSESWIESIQESIPPE